MLCGEDPICTFCNSKLKNEITHYIFDCYALKEERRTLMLKTGQLWASLPSIIDNMTQNKYIATAFYGFHKSISQKKAKLERIDSSEYQRIIKRRFGNFLSRGHPSLRRWDFLRYNADITVQLALHALLHPVHQASARETYIGLYWTILLRYATLKGGISEMRFLKGDFDLHDKERPGKPSTATTDQNLDLVEEIVKNNRTITTYQLMKKLSISKEVFLNYFQILAIEKYAKNGCQSF
ncbi:hypothetical protein LAZ67_13002698 [Cordylochernes scorpioides]|uniref:Reverse transcriptase zinc-binding domain-containing protein n=1 Tax=Cordylochernes scorpioides TaxID=51811 RepID=A0ABY6L5N8_9ARAC|nr:hypothetical protein LAZ67_13002698 [Cordylochernes scorpioides]